MFLEDFFLTGVYRVPWSPELFSAPTLVRVLEKLGRDELETVPYYDGLMTGEFDPLVESFAGEPELHNPVRGRAGATRSLASTSR